MIAAVYARKSTDQAVADEQKSVTRQIDHARQYAARKGWTVADEHVYVDDGISGAEFANRPGFLRLMNAVKPRAPFKVLIVSELSRLGREQLETGYAVKQLSQGGVRIFSYLEEKEVLLDTATDKFLLAVLNFGAELEQEKARQRSTDKAAQLFRDGHVPGGRVFGYDNVRVGSHSERQINDEAATIVRRIFEMSAAGHGLKAIAKRLNEERAPSPRAQQGRSQTWAPSSVREVLFRDLYRGVVTWNKTRKRNGWGQQAQHDRPAAEWLTVSAPQLRVVGDDLWNRAHARMAAARAVYKLGGRPALGSQSPYLLTNLALCGVCGGPMRVRTRKAWVGRSAFYGCSNYHERGRTVCGNRADVPMEDADNIVLEALLDDVLDPELLEESVDGALDLITDAAGTPDPLVPLEAEIRRVTEERDRFVAAIAAGGSLDAVLAALRTREETLKALEGRRIDMRSIAGGRGPTIDCLTVRGQLLTLADSWRSVLKDDRQHARPIVTTLLSGRVTLTPTAPKQWHLHGVGTIRGLFEGEIFPCPS